MAQNLKTVKLIHLAICSGAILAYIVIGQFTFEQLIGQKISSDNLFYLAIPIAAFVLSNFMFKSHLKQVKPQASAEEKLSLYQTASIIRWAILEGAALAILFLKPDFFIFGILLILYLIYLRPTEENFTNAFQSNVR